MLELLAVIPYPDLDPVLFRLGPIAIRWYGLAYLAGLFLAYFWLVRMARRGMLKSPAADVNGLVVWLAVGIMAGARLGWWLIYHSSPTGPEPWYEPIATWHGGMSFHGGLVGVIVALVVFTWRKKIPFRNLMDCSALIAPVGLFFGRIANFINAELVGRPSDVPWAMVFPRDTVPRHPSQLYEALLEGPVLLGILWAAKRTFRPAEGVIAALFLIFYGSFRFLVEFTREPDVQIGFIAFGWLTAGQALSLAMAAAGAGLWIWSCRAPDRTIR